MERLEGLNGSGELEELAALAGYQDNSNPNSVGGEEPLIDPNELIPENTKIPVWEHPIAKASVVGGLGLGAIVILSLILGGIHLGNNTARSPRIEMESGNGDLIEDPATARLRAAEAEVSTLKTENAIGNQAQAIALQESRENFANSRTGLATPAEREAPAVEEPTEVVQIQQPPRPTPPPTRVAQPPPARQAARPRPAQPPPKVNPQEQWDDLARLGSYGSLTVPERQVVAPPAGEQRTMTEDVALDIPSTPSPLFVSQVSTDDPLTNLRYQADKAAILGIPSVPLKVINPGATATATLTTPIFWAQDMKAEEQPQRFSLTLSDALIGDDGSEAIPVGAQIVAEVAQVSNSGLVQLTVTSFLMPRGEGFEEVDLPSEGFVIQGEDGDPLIADERDSNSAEIRNAEIQLGIIGALGNVGEILNRPESSSIVSTTTSTFSSTNNGSANILGGLAEGAANAILSSRQSQLENQVSRLNSNDPIWYIEAGTAVQIFVTERVSFQGEVAQ